LTPVKKGSYEFKADSLVEIRKKLKISQAEMARQIGVPPNTLSRWENKSTVPDANSLATIYSIAKDNGIVPTFFGIRKDAKTNQKIRDRLLVMWDFWTLGLQSYQVEEAEAWLKDQVKKRTSNTSIELYKAFSHPSQSNATDVLEKLGWRVWEDNSDMDEELIDQVRSDAGQDPEATILFIITRDEQFIDLIDEMQRKGVRVYVVGPSNSNANLVETVGNKRWIEWENINFWTNLPLLR
jgi:transcriptional regulator with XRE-family HTH domain